MSVTYYHSTNGVLRGETTGASSTDYMLDGMGSVSATVDQSQSVLATFRFRPFGERMSKTGTGTDPRFAWRSSASLVSNAVELFNAVVIPSMGYQMVSAFRKSGTFRDGGLGEDVPECGGRGAEWNKIIPLPVFIELDYKSINKFRQPTPCWQYNFSTIWRLTEESKKIGIGAVIQNVTFLIDQYSCKDQIPSLRCNLSNYSEAWTVTNGKFDNRVTGEVGSLDYQTDTFMMPKYYDCTYGISSMVGSFGFYGGCAIKEGSQWSTGNGTCTGGPWGNFLLGQWGAPNGFKFGDGRKSLGYRTNCCLTKKGYAFDLSFSSSVSAAFHWALSDPEDGREVCKGMC